MKALEKYLIPEKLIPKAVTFSEFRQGGAVCTVSLKDQSIFHGVLLSGGKKIIAVRGYAALPFDSSHIVNLYQSAADLEEKGQTSWEFFRDAL